MTWTLQPKLRLKTGPQYWTGKALTCELDKAKTFQTYEQAARHLMTHKHLRPFLEVLPVQVHEQLVA